jgi:cytochrome bd-type quinol oxidase subunit 2
MAALMSGYAILRVAHSYWRWAIVLGAIVVLGRAITGLKKRREWTNDDERASRMFVATVDLQFLLGLILYFGFSPFWSAIRDSFHAAMKDPTTRFFAIEHETAMFLALAAVHIGRVRAKRATDALRKHRIMLITIVIFVVLVLVAVPWPWRSFGRPLFRLSW